MWPFSTIKKHLLVITCTPHELTCSLIQSTDRAHRYALYAYHHYPFAHAECEQLLLCNPTRIRAYIQEIITTYNLGRGMAIVSLSGPPVAERVITVAGTDPTYHQIIDPRLKGFIWDSCYLYHQEESGHAAFYVAGIKQAVLLQYKLLFATLPIHLIGITTESMALLYLYKQLYGSTFRPAQLAKDIKSIYGSRLHPLISDELMRRSLAINPSLTATALHTSPTMRTALGLFLLGKNGYETD